MFPNKAWLSIAVACVLLLPSLALASGKSTDLAQLKEQLRSAPTVEYCELWRHSEMYDGRIVRVRAVYMTDFEASTIASPACDIPISSFVGQTWVDYDPIFDKLTQRKWRKKLEHMKWRTGLDSVFVGRFESTRHDRIHGFGHMDMYTSHLVVMSAEQVQSLGKFSALPGAVPEKETTPANQPRQLTLCEALKLDPDDPVIRVTATLDVLKETSLLRNRDCPEQNYTPAEFSTYWRASTRPDTAKAIDRKREKSGTRWPERGISLVELRFESLDVVLEGFLTTYPFDNDPGKLGIDPNSISALRINPEMVFFVQCVISVQKTPK
jgi:hypothetical protein